MIVDTTVLIDLVNGKVEAGEFLVRQENLAISRISIMELLFGARSKKELKGFLKQIDSLGCEVIEISEEVSRLAGELLEKYVLSHGMGVADALVAAAAVIKRDILVTHNIKHFRFIRELKVVKPY